MNTPTSSAIMSITSTNVRSGAKLVASSKVATPTAGDCRAGEVVAGRGAPVNLTSRRRRTGATDLAGHVGAVLDGVGEERLFRRHQVAQIRLHRRDVSFALGVGELRDRDRGQNADNHDHDQQLNECETLAVHDCSPYGMLLRRGPSSPPLHPDACKRYAPFGKLLQHLVGQPITVTGLGSPVQRRAGFRRNVAFCKRAEAVTALPYETKRRGGAPAAPAATAVAPPTCHPARPPWAPY